jgi:hypothetical protein
MRWRLGDHEWFARQQPIDLPVPRLCKNDSAVVTFLTPLQDTAVTNLKLLCVNYLAVLLASYLFLY